MLAGLDKKKILQAKKRHLSASFSLNTAIRAICVFGTISHSKRGANNPFIQEYIAKYYKKKTLQKAPFVRF